jgi:hypothetical protein
LADTSLKLLQYEFLGQPAVFLLSRPEAVLTDSVMNPATLTRLHRRFNLQRAKESISQAII